MGYFRAKVNGTYRMFTHYPTHKANARKIALKKFKENRRELLKLKEVKQKDIVDTFESGFNMGYKDAIKRIKDVGFVQDDSGKLNLVNTKGCNGKKTSNKPNTK